MVMLDLLTYIIFDRLHFFIEVEVGISIENFIYSVVLVL